MKKIVIGISFLMAASVFSTGQPKAQATQTTIDIALQKLFAIAFMKAQTQCFDLAREAGGKNVAACIHNPFAANRELRREISHRTTVPK